MLKNAIKGMVKLEGKIGRGKNQCNSLTVLNKKNHMLIQKGKRKIVMNTKGTTSAERPCHFSQNINNDYD